MELINLTVDEAQRLMLSNDNIPMIGQTWSLGTAKCDSVTPREHLNLTRGLPLISLRGSDYSEEGLHEININFVNNTSIIIEFNVTSASIGQHTVYNIGNTFTFYFMNNATNERFTWTSTTVSGTMSTDILGKTIYFLIVDDTRLNELVYPCVCIVGTSSLGLEWYVDENYRRDWWYYPLENIPDWFLEGNQKPDYPGDESDTGGGSGSYIGRNDVIGIPNFPSISALGTGFINAYNPNTNNLEAFSNWLWSSDFSENVKKNQASPFDNIISFGFVPLGLSTTYDTIHIGNYDTQIGCNKISTEYYEIDTGWLDIYEYWGGFLDYQAEYQIYLPYIGYQPIRASEFVDGMIRVVYHISCLTGLLQCFVQCQKNGIPHVLYSFCGNCFSDLPINGANFLQMKLQLQQSVVNGVTGAINGAIQGAQSGGIIGAVGGLIGGAVGGGYNYAMNKASAKPDYQHGGGLSGNGGMFAIRYPYLIETKQITQIPKNYNKLVGIPSMVTRKLSDLTGYTEVYEVLDEKLTCTESEKKQIYELLKGGVYIND